MSMPKFSVNCSEGICEHRFVIGNQEVDENGNMLWGALARRMQPITEDHLKMCGVDHDALMALGKTWIISWSGMNINRLPKLDERIILRIWPSNRKMMMHTRKYCFYTDTGEALLSVASIFMLMDLEKRCAVDSSDYIPEIETVSIDDEPALPKMRFAFPKEYTNSVKRTVSENEIDYNGHMNNSYYLDWAQSVVNNQKEPKGIWIQYSNELLKDDCANILYEWKNEELFGKISNNNEDAFLFKINF